MLGLLTRAPHARFSPVLFSVEYLEDRNAPSTLSMDVTYLPNQQVTLSGSLSGADNVANQMINIMGAAQGEATTDDSGNYSITLTASQLGAVTAQTADGASNVAQVNLVSNQVFVSLGASCLGGGYWDIQGQVSSSNLQGVVVTFGGAASGQANINPDGSFDITVYTANPQDVVTATAVNWWGDSTDTASVTIYGDLSPAGGGSGGLV
jgi:hypothetical protein